MVPSARRASQAVLPARRLANNHARERRQNLRKLRQGRSRRTCLLAQHRGSLPPGSKLGPEQIVNGSGTGRPSGLPGAEALAFDGGHTRCGVVGVDGSPTSFRALAFSCGWARRLGSDLIVAYVAEPPLQRSVDCYSAAAAHQCADEICADLRRQLTNWMSGQPIAWTFAVPVGQPPSELERVAAAHDADAIIVGQSRRRRLRRPVCARLSRLSARIIIAVP